MLPAAPRLVVEVRLPAPAARGGLVVYVDLFLADVLLDDLLVLDDVLADPYLLPLSMRGTKRAEVWILALPFGVVR